MHLIEDPKRRNERILEKQNVILSFLKDEIYSSTKVLAILMGVKQQSATRTLKRLVERGYLIKDKITFMESTAVVLWGIAPKGLLEISSVNEIEMNSYRTYSKGRVSPRTIEHTLDIHNLRCECISRGFSYWIPTRCMPGNNKKRGHYLRWKVYPDAIATLELDSDSRDLKFAFEVERTRKSIQRYVQLIKGHLDNMQQGRYSSVYYYCPKKKMTNSLQSLFFRIIEEKEYSLFINDEVVFGPHDVKDFFVFKTLDIDSS